MRGRTLIAAAAVAGILTGAAPATSTTPLVRSALKALATPRVTPTTKEHGRGEIRRAAYLARVLPSGRREHVRVALAELASFAGQMTEPRALSLIGELKANDDYFLKHYAPQPKTDITDADGIVYRYFAGRCFEFHPLANFGALNARVAQGDAAGAQRLAAALVARGVYQRTGGIGWEYTFPYGGGRAPWLSGMAQAVAAQALARAAGLLPTESASLMGKARAAYQTIPGRLLTSVAAGPWIRLYSFTSLPVLNAQLQTVISLQSYATTANDDVAATLAARMQRAAAASLARFDTGYWSYYALPHDPSPLDYHEYVVQLLQRLKSADPRFADAAVRFAAYEQQPPAFQLAPAPLGAVTFWISKPSTVSASTPAGPARRITVDGGWHTLAWGEPKQSGAYGVHLSATDAAGNRASFDALPIVRAAATLPTRGTQATAAVPTGTTAFLVGAGITDPAQAAALTGLRLLRLALTWPPGAAALDATTVAGLAQLSHTSAVIELTASPLPTDDAGRAALAQYASSVAAQLRQQDVAVRALVLTPARTVATGPDYDAALGGIGSAAPETPLGLALDGSTDPAGVVDALAGAAIDVVAFRPAATAGKNLWTLADVGKIRSAFPTAQVIIDGAPAPYAAAIKAAACTPGVTGVVLDRSSDVARASLQAAIRTAQRGAFVCPGVTFETSPLDEIQYPVDGSAPGPIRVSLNCDRDCLYLATLDRADGRPVVAVRGELAGGVEGQSAALRLPRGQVPPGTYRIDVRLVARVNPGAVTRQVSPPLAYR